MFDFEIHRAVGEEGGGGAACVDAEAGGAVGGVALEDDFAVWPVAAQAVDTVLDWEGEHVLGSGFKIFLSGHPLFDLRMLYNI